MESAQGFTVGWICALEIEYAAACDVLDERYNIQGPADGNSYTFGRIDKHKIVIACLPKGRYGITSAALVAERLRSSFSNVEFGLMVGIAGGAPSPTQDIRLGDVVVSSPGPKHGGVIQYDYGKTIQDLEFEQTGFLAPPPEKLLTAMTHLSVQHKSDGHRISETVTSMGERNPDYNRPTGDRLCISSYVHLENCDCQNPNAGGTNFVQRHLRADSNKPIIHYGLVASANSLLKDAIVRDTLVKKHQILCFEMEAAGIMNTLPCLVIRGICDYCDTHKNKKWQGYAAAAAAAYTKELLEVVPSKDTQQVLRFVVPFSLAGIPVARKFIGRSEQISNLCKALLPQDRRQIYVLSGLGGIGKTQLAVEFCRRYSSQFTAVFWLDGSSKDTLIQSFIHHASRIPADKTWDSGIVEYLRDNADAIVRAFLHWLEHQSNKKWLVVYDNVDREFLDSDPLSYDVEQFIPKTDHGSLLITTRRPQLGQLGKLEELGRVEFTTAKEILSSWSRKSHDQKDMDQLLTHLDGLPLAIAQAGAFLQESGMDMKTYLRLYEDRRQDVAEWLQGSALKEYPNRSEWTAWTLSYEAVHTRDQYAANLLLLWSFIDRNDFWFGLFEKPLAEDSVAQRLEFWLGNIPTDEIAFIKAMSLLRSYCLVEGPQDSQVYTMHTVLHRWTYLRQAVAKEDKLGPLTVELIGLSIEWRGTRLKNESQLRILAHALICVEKLLGDAASDHSREALLDKLLKDKTGILAIHLLAMLCSDQGRYLESEKLYKIVLKAREDMFGHDHTLTLNVVGNLANLYRLQERSEEAEALLLRILDAYKGDPWMDGDGMLDVLNTLCNVYAIQRKMERVEQMREKLLSAFVKARGLKDPSTLDAINNLGNIYKQKHRFAEAETVYQQALREKTEVFGPLHESTLMTILNLAQLRLAQDKDGEAEQLFLQASEGCRLVLGSSHPMTCGALSGLAALYDKQDRFLEAADVNLRALQGYESLGPMVATYSPALSVMLSLGREWLFELDRASEGRILLQRALDGYRVVDGDDSELCTLLRDILSKDSQEALSKEDHSAVPSGRSKLRAKARRWLHRHKDGKKASS